MRFNYIFMYKCRLYFKWDISFSCGWMTNFESDASTMNAIALLSLTNFVQIMYNELRNRQWKIKWGRREPKLGIIRDRIYIFTILYVQWIRLHFSARLQVHSSRLVYGLSKNTFLWKRELLKSNVIFQEKTLIANHPKSKNLEFWNANYFKSIANAMFSQRRQ